LRAKQQKGNATVQVRLPLGSLGACRCTPHDVDAYRSRISGPLLDRIDLHVEVPALWYEEIASAPMRALGLSARGYARVLKVARTIADLAGEPKIGITHIAESIQYREQPRHMG